ncbi:1,3-beta-galactosyl-N-acetylhexosamine phosphorylase [Romboutsia lituseburensis]|uniref:1,3-beta-galactosyl-N-acetylhexosamine phosphorylase n=1 Tax=Romboutsia lituseburensis TaxID=1537 RepID=UPI00215A88F4|nr:1,3-beta-galactosyl-N-acetylhexosamine phosphorylase [Romboutsia lituseburensis]MCR8744039.1 1,3-beta-galactosyl-N-acetylhexosamine phosphorylase [Romboutsia lituseburensis]
MQSKGRVTIPTDIGIDDQMKLIIKRWGADAIRDCDGTKLSSEFKSLNLKMYSTYLPTRNDQKWAKEHMNQLQQLYITSESNIATDKILTIDIMKGIYKEQFRPNIEDDIKSLWEVIDRTTGNVLNCSNWDYDFENGNVAIKEAIPFHEYTVSFLAYQIWDPTQMYNHLTNNWGDKPHEMPYDGRHPETFNHMKKYLKNWIEENPEIDVVRFTTFFYHFTLIYNEQAKEKFVDWFGYSSSLSKQCLDEFEKEKGYRLKAEDIVDEGYYNSPFRIPSKKYLDFIDFQSKFVATNAKEFVDIAHSAKKEAMMFLGDNWIGTEPYGKYFESIGLDAVVGSVGNGTTMRMISDISGVKYTEGRFLPYFFPDVFREGGNPVGEAKENWTQARRAILRKPLDRIGYGGYLGLALKFPEFIDEVERICEEFRTIHNNIKGTKAYAAPFKVAILNCWGKLRSWQTNQVAHALWYKEIYSYVGVIECLSGMPVDVEFINFDDIKNGVPKDIGVIINAGDAMTSWSGGENWIDEKIITTLRKWVYEGGGFIGIGEPTAYQNQGKYFQLFDVLGVDKDLTYRLSYRKYHEIETKHFITEELNETFDFGEGKEGIFKREESVDILSMHKGDISLSSNTYGNGRAVYISGLPYNPENCRLLLRSIYWVKKREDIMKKYYVSNINTECAAFLDVNKMAIINNSFDVQSTDVYIEGNLMDTLVLHPGELVWINID